MGAVSARDTPSAESAARRAVDTIPILLVPHDDGFANHVDELDAGRVQLDLDT